MSGLTALDIHEIVRCMEATECGAILVPPRILRRVIKLHRRIAGVGFDVPHPHVYVITKEELLGLADQEELAHAQDALSDSVILLPVPEVDPTGDRTDAIVSLWRGALHGAIHRDLDGRIARGEITESDIRARVHVIGQTEFDEIRMVLHQDDLLLPPEDEASIFVAETYVLAAATPPMRTWESAAKLAPFRLIENCPVVTRLGDTLHTDGTGRVRTSVADPTEVG